VEVGLAMQPWSTALGESAEDRGRSASALRPGSAGIYWDPTERLRLIVPFLREALGAGGRVIHLVSDRPVEQARAELAEVGLSEDCERLTLLRAAEVLAPSGRLDPGGGARALHALFPAADGSPSRLVIEMDFLVGLADGPSPEQLERTLREELLRPRQVLCLYAFNAAGDVPPVLGEALGMHPVLLSNGIPLLNPYYRPSLESGA
jgi:hypothetical protein